MHDQIRQIARLRPFGVQKAVLIFSVILHMAGCILEMIVIAAIAYRMHMKPVRTGCQPLKVNIQQHPFGALLGYDSANGLALVA